ERDILGLWAGEHGDGEGAKFWLRVLSEIKNRGTADVLMGKHSGLSRRVIRLSRWVTGRRRCCAHAGRGGIQGFPVRASRMAVMTGSPCLRAVSR
ncbi:MAG TPA: transposase, partial [Trebonia sp.]